MFSIIFGVCDRFYCMFAPGGHVWAFVYILAIAIWLSQILSLQMTQTDLSLKCAENELVDFADFASATGD